MKLDMHHIFSKSEANIKKYGKDLINDPRNLIYIDHDEHLSKPIPKFNDRTFCEALDLLHCRYCRYGQKNNETPVCLFFHINLPGDIAHECRMFDFDKTKY